MRQVIYSAAASLDGYIARTDGSHDWIPMDPEIDFGAMFGRFDTVVMGRKTHEVAAAIEGENPFSAMETFVFSRTRKPGKHTGVEYREGSPGNLIQELRKVSGRDIWLMGGGELTREFLREDLVDGIQVAVVPVVLGGGVPLFAPGFAEDGEQDGDQECDDPDDDEQLDERESPAPLWAS